MQITLDTAKAVYRKAIDSRAGDGEGAAWWDEIADEVRDVIAARSLAEAAAMIEWWHRDWIVLSEPRGAAKRTR